MMIPGGHDPKSLMTEELVEGSEERPKADIISKLTRALSGAKAPTHGDLIDSQLIEDAQKMLSDLTEHKKKLKDHEKKLKETYSKGADSLQAKIEKIVSTPKRVAAPLVDEIDDDAGPSSPEKTPPPLKAENTKFLCDPEELQPSQGEPEKLNDQGELLKFGDTDLAMVSLQEVLKHPGVPEKDEAALQAIRDEFKRNGSDDDKLCMEYVLDKAAGTCDRLWQQGLKLDCDSNGQLRADRTVDGQPGGQGKTLQHFCAEAKGLFPPGRTPLSPPEVAAIRLYTTIVYKKINEPLREGDGKAPDHPLPVTLLCLNKALKKLRDKKGGDGQLWRGFKDKEVPEEFLRSGGMELSPMSTTTSLKTAVEYSDSDHPALMRITCRTYQQRGVDISCFSAFAAEEEILFPPRSTLFPVQKGAAPTVLDVTVGDGKKTWRIYDVEGYFPSSNDG